MRCGKKHMEMVDGRGACSVPMWRDGMPAGFCDAPAYGKPVPTKMYRRADGTRYRADGRYDGYVPGLACPSHGGPSQKEVAHHGDPCKHCGVAHDDVPPGPCSGRVEALYDQEEG